MFVKVKETRSSTKRTKSERYSKTKGEKRKTNILDEVNIITRGGPTEEESSQPVACINLHFREQFLSKFTIFFF